MEGDAQYLMIELKFDSIFIEIDENQKLLDISYIDESDQPWGQQEFIKGSASWILMGEFYNKVEESILNGEITKSIIIKRKLK